MGRVVLATDEVLSIDVALKLVPEEVVRDAGGLRDLKAEVLRGMALSHPNIVRVHSFEQEGDRGAIVMEFVDGVTLADEKDEQPHGCFDHETLRPWLEQLCSVLDHAHREVRIAHRDLKPRNLLLTPERRLKVADFGISCSLADTVHRLTTTGSGGISGTPPYMSPQQAMGEPPSHLDDIYALGATLYDLLTGKPPCYRGNVVMQAMQQRPPSIAARRRELGKDDMPPVPENWEHLVAACLAKQPEERPGSGQEILSILQSSGGPIRRGGRSPLEQVVPAPHTGGMTTQERFAAQAPRSMRRVLPRLRRDEGDEEGRSSGFAEFLQLSATAIMGGALLAGILYFPRWAAKERTAAAGSSTEIVAATPAPPPVGAPPTTPAAQRAPMGSQTSLQPASGLDRPPPEQRPPPPRRGPR
jgi:serine/threonine protein kinase